MWLRSLVSTLMNFEYNSVYIVAEIGVNHNGSLLEAKKLVDAAKDSGVNAVKFQVFLTDKLLVKTAEKAAYQKKTDSFENQYTMLSSLELNQEELTQLFEHCNGVGIDYFSSAFDVDSIDFLNKLGQKIWKIPSGEINNLPLLLKISAIAKTVIISTGMANLDEIKVCLEIFKNNEVILLHCTSNYPTNAVNVNIRTIALFKEEFSNIKVGFSDHTQGITAAQLAVAMGAVFIEKHFTLNNEAPGPDHQASLNPSQMKDYVEGIRLAEIMLGVKDKIISMEEMDTKLLVRKSIYASTKINKGDEFSSKNLITLRPALGINPMQWNKLLGRISSRTYQKGQIIEFDEIGS